MPQSARAPRPAFQLIDRHPQPADLRREVFEGLRRTPRTLPPKLFYDARGSELFEEITLLPEYYLTRTEVGILQKNAGEIVGLMGASPAIIELGSGSSAKVRILFNEISGPLTYVAFDISLDHLRASAETLAADYPRARIIAVCADYSTSLELPELDPTASWTIFFPGSNIGNLDPDEARRFFRAISSILRPGDGMLLGMDRVKDPEVLHAAYNDSRGITAEFNLNLLRRINQELGGDFDLDAFRHLAWFNEQKSRIEMHLESRRAQVVTISGERFRFAAGERIHTENSYKYKPGDLADLIDGSRFELEASWTDPEGWFGVEYLRVY